MSPPRLGGGQEGVILFYSFSGTQFFGAGCGGNIKTPELLLFVPHFSHLYVDIG